MGRLFFLVLINLGAFFVLRQLWPSVRAGWRRGAFIALTVLSALAMAVPRLLDHGGFRLVSWLDVPLRLFGAAWSIASLIVLFFGWPLALVRSRRERARAKVSGAPPAEDVNLRRRGLLAGAGRALPFVAVGTSTVGLVEGAS
ncbi:MAG: metallophosphoesterase, partial [Cystobacter sp.]